MNQNSFTQKENNQIIEKKILAPQISLIKVYNPEISRKAQPGQFVVLRIYKNGERIPLTIADSNSQDGTITIVFQKIGATTKLLDTLKPNDVILDILGPLGHPAHIKNFGTVVCIGGGVGIAEIYPVAKSYKKNGNKVISILGARNKDLIIFYDEIKSISDECYVTTDDGSFGKKGFVTDVLKDLMQRENISLVSAVGPTIMMKVVSNLTKEKGIKTLVSLNPIMLDATGMCGVCRVTVDGKVKFACVDGPEFDGHLVDFDELMSRQKIYLSEEQTAIKVHCSDENPNCRCKL